PGLCTQCGSKICSCPAIPLATVGRMAKEINITTEENLFIDDLNSFERAGSEAAQSALESMGGFAGLVDKLPFDRGDTNHGLVQICMKIAAAFEASSPDIASKLRGEAIRLGDLMKEAGTPRENLDIADLISKLRTLWKELDEKHRTEIKDSGGLTSDIGEIFDSVRVLFVSCNPNTPERPLKLHVEQRAVKESLKLGPHGNKISISDLHAATPDDFRRELLHNEYDVIHFSGHADENALIFETLDNRPIEVSIDAVKNMISQYKSIKCVVLNACESAKKITHSISNITIGMDETIPDDAAIAFSRGFYDALAAGKDFQRAFKEGVTAVEIAGHGGDYIKMITAA
ncbi:MAG TPA: CHAT domain-containing protein, partial [Bosea sp. (in: a-proteobacteria)]|nr:CHAT domain-containing protein [Bosea sp. (in: a-proteobacteria)]